jgi:hypothetical protein
MAVTQTEWPHRQQIQVESVTYDIFIHADCDGSFQSSWACLGCGEKAFLTPIRSTADEALLLAEMGIEVHHQLLHGVSRMPR